VLGQTKIGGGAIERRIDAASDSRLGLYYLGASYTFDGPWQLDGQLSRLDVKDSPKASNLAVLRATYYLSRRTAVHASVGRMQNKGGAAIALDAGGTVARGAEPVWRADGRAPRVLASPSPRRATALP
jgi:predicted porin